MKKIEAVCYLLISGAVLMSACAPAATKAKTMPTGLNSIKVTMPTQTAATAVPTTAISVADAVVAQSLSTAIELNTDYDNAAPIALQLLLGTLKLQGTDLAVTAEQASTLLPLWNNLKTISQSAAPALGQANATPQPQSGNSETQAQLTALVKQIQAAMTADQIKAIAAMKITRETAMTILQEQGITLGGPQSGNGGNAGNGNPPPQGTPPASGPDNASGNAGLGAPPNGQPPSGGQQPNNGSGAAPQGGGGMVPLELINVLIQLLEKTSGN